MNQIVKIYKEQPIRIMERNGETWFVAKDVAEILGYADAFSMTRRLDEDEQEKLETTEMAVSSFGHGGARQFTIINESGLYNAILGSQKPEAKDFRRWVTHDVLPSIRRTGSYSVEQSLKDGENLSSLSGVLQDIIEQNAMLREKNAYLSQFAPKSDFGDPNKEGFPKYQKRRGYFVSAKGAETSRLDPEKNGYIQLDFFYDRLPSILIESFKKTIAQLCTGK